MVNDTCCCILWWWAGKMGWRTGVAILFAVCSLFYGLVAPPHWCTQCMNGARQQWFPTACVCDAGWAGPCCTVRARDACSASSEHCCPQDMLIANSIACSSVGWDGPITPGEAPLPPQLQGLWWLQDQGSSSSVVGFGRGDDGCGMSNGVLGKDGRYAVRVHGDSHWGFNDNTDMWSLVHSLDLVYEFQFDDALGPTRGTITPYSLKYDCPLLRAVTWLLRFDMVLDTDPHPTYTTSRRWGRRSYVLGQELRAFRYALVQVIDGEGNVLQPAYDHWLEYCRSPVAGDSPGLMFYTSKAERV